MSIKSKYNNVNFILGLFDTCGYIDYVTYNLNSKQNIKTICIPHGINFKYKVSYISYGTNYYTFWGENHLERMDSSNLLALDDVCKVITGNVSYSDMKLGISLEKRKKHNKKILIVGEYFSKDNYYTSPFNATSTRLLFEEISKFSKDNECEVTVRARLEDEYYNIANLYTSDLIKMSSSNINILDQINEHDLVVSIFSNVLHEGLLLKKDVMQINILEVENYRDLAKHGLVYYVSNTEDIVKNLDKWFREELEPLDFNKHEQLYCNEGKFSPINLCVSDVEFKQ